MTRSRLSLLLLAMYCNSLHAQDLKPAEFIDSTSFVRRGLLRAFHSAADKERL